MLENVTGGGGREGGSLLHRRRPGPTDSYDKIIINLYIFQMLSVMGSSYPSFSQKGVRHAQIQLKGAVIGPENIVAGRGFLYQRAKGKRKRHEIPEVVSRTIFFFLLRWQLEIVYFVSGFPLVWPHKVIFRLAQSTVENNHCKHRDVIVPFGKCAALDH